MLCYDDLEAALPFGMKSKSYATSHANEFQLSSLFSRIEVSSGHKVIAMSSLTCPQLMSICLFSVRPLNLTTYSRISINALRWFPLGTGMDADNPRLHPRIAYPQFARNRGWNSHGSAGIRG